MKDVGNKVWAVERLMRIDCTTRAHQWYTRAFYAIQYAMRHERENGYVGAELSYWGPETWSGNEHSG